MENNNHQDRRRNGQYYREGRVSAPGQDRSQYYYGDGQYGGPQYYNNPQGNNGGGNGSGGDRKDEWNNDRKNDRKKKKRSKIGDVISGLLMLIALGVFLYSGYMLYGFYMDYKQGTDEYESLGIYAVNDEGETENLAALEQLQEETVEEMTEPETTVIEENGQQIRVPTMKNPVNFTELEKVNEDIVGWIKVRAIDISYPIVQGEDNDFYLHRTFEKVDNFAGCIFMNSGNKSDFTDQNTIIYGHNMKNGSMFGKLKKFQEEEIFDKSEYFWIYTPDVIYQYHIFSAMTVNKTGLTYQTFYMDDEFDELIDVAFRNSVVDNSDMKVEENDRIVTLSTCTGNDATRFVVMGKLAQIYAVRK